MVIGVLVNQSKSGLFTIEERIEMLREVTAPYPNVRVDAFRGLLGRLSAATSRPPLVVKGLRAVQ